MEKVKRFEDLIIWKEARELCKKVYDITSTVPFSQDIRFVQQMHASAGSIMDNIAEGFERAGNKEFINFLFFAKGSCGELRSQIIRATDVGYLTKDMAKALYNDCQKTGALIMTLIKELQNSEFRGAKYFLHEDDPPLY
ncbi:MAG: four helix bundle protein [Bacteroidaceae bacterium]|nr:four helix bundle protein [Bacteroidaceae bacterium]